MQNPNTISKFKFSILHAKCNAKSKTLSTQWYWDIHNKLYNFSLWN
jgi:hypothetical protein